VTFADKVVSFAVVDGRALSKGDSVLDGRAGHTSWIRFVSGGGCSSKVGRQGSDQDITLGAGCGRGQAIHEIGHSVGLWHEQQGLHG
jgi:hypothetical protein